MPNQAFYRYKLNALVVHHHSSWIGEPLKDPDLDVFISEYDCNMIKWGSHTYPGSYQYKSIPNTGNKVALDFTYIDNPKKDHIFTGGNTVLDAIGLSVYFGVKNIVLCGCDGGAINGENNYSGYYTDLTKEREDRQKKHSKTASGRMVVVRDHLKKKGINLVTLSPFMGLGLEGNMLV